MGKNEIIEKLNAIEAILEEMLASEALAEEISSDPNNAYDCVLDMSGYATVALRKLNEKS